MSLTFSPAVPAEVAVTDKAVMLFRDACLATAPSFRQAMAVARKHGVKPQADLGASVVGMGPGGSFSLQVRAGKECAVTSESDPGPEAAEQFKAVIATAAGGPVSGLTGDGTAITLGGQSYLVRHDRKGGEAYVIVNARGL